MRKFFYLILSITVFFSSCKKNSEIIPGTEEELTTPAINQILATNNILQQRNMYKLLSPEEKVEIWKIKFSKFMKHPSLNEDQVHFINKISTLLNADIFSNKSKLNEYEIKGEAIKLFGVAGSYSLLATLKTVPEPSLVEPGGGTCSCSGASDWCGSRAACYTLGCSYSSGCGTLWQYTCDGTCVPYHVY